MKKALLTLACLLGLFMPSLVFIAPSAEAVNILPQCTGSSTDPDVCNSARNQGSGNPIIDTIKNIIKILSYAVGVASAIILVISGLRMVIDGGDPKVVEQARTGIIYALAGIAVTILAQILVSFVLNKL